MVVLGDHWSLHSYPDYRKELFAGAFIFSFYVGFQKKALVMC